MKAFNCQSMKAAILFSAVLFAAGVFMQVPALTSLFDAKYFEVILAFLGLMGMFAAFALALVIAVVTLFPKASKRLKLCEH
jgi:hypothetical protein